MTKEINGGHGGSGGSSGGGGEREGGGRRLILLRNPLGCDETIWFERRSFNFHVARLTRTPPPTHPPSERQAFPVSLLCGGADSALIRPVG